MAISGFGGNIHATLTGVIAQTAKSFSVTGASFSPQTSSAAPPMMTLTGTFTGGGSNAYQNWAFTVAGMNNGGNNGTYIATASTASTLTFVNPQGVTESGSSGPAVSSATTADYCGTYTSHGFIYGSMNGMAGQDHISVSGFTNVGNNTSVTTAPATAYSWSGGYLTITGANSWGVGQIITINATDLTLLNGQEFAVYSASPTQYLIAENSYLGSGTTNLTSTSTTVMAIANSPTVMSVVNPSAVTETAAGTLTVAPSLYNAEIGVNTINMGQSSGSCAGVMLGNGPNGQGTLYNVHVHDLNVSATNGYTNCAGIYIATGLTTPESIGFDLKSNVFSNIFGIRYDASAGSFDDLTIEGNKDTGSSVAGGNNPAIFRYWDNVSETPGLPQTNQVLNGGLLIDTSGDLTTPAGSSATFNGTATVNGTLDVFGKTPGQPGTYLFSADNTTGNPNVLFAAPYPFVVAKPTGMPSISGGTVAASTTNIAYITCVAAPWAGGETPATYVSNNVSTTGSTSSIAWAWTAQTGCYTYHIWVAAGGVTPTYYFSSNMNSYTQTAPASSGTPGTFPQSVDYTTARMNSDGALVIRNWSPPASGWYNSITNPIGSCGGTHTSAWVTDATSLTGTYVPTGGGNGSGYSIPVACTYYGSSGTWYSEVGAGSGSGTITGVTAGTGLTGGGTSGTVTVSLSSQYRTWSCQTGVGDGYNAIPAQTYLQSFCKNTTGVSITLTGVQCSIDGGSSSTLNAAGNTLGALLTGAVTCSTSFAAGTQSANVTLTNGDYIKFTFVADGTAKQSTWVVTGTY